MTVLISHHDHYFTTVFSVKREVGFDATIALHLVLFSVILKSSFGKDAGYLVIDSGIYKHVPMYCVL